MADGLAERAVRRDRARAARTPGEFAICVGDLLRGARRAADQRRDRGLRRRRRQRRRRSTRSRSRARSSSRSPPSGVRESGRFAGVACLGAVIRGETDHYDYVCDEAARGVQDVQLDTGVPVRVRRPHLRDDGAGARSGRRRQARPGQARRARGDAHGAAARRAGPGLARPRYHHPSQWPRSVTAAARGPRSGTRGATRWSPPGAASTRTCRRSGSTTAGRTRRVYVCTRCLKAEQGRQGRVAASAG